MADRSLTVPEPSRQIAFHQLLVGARKAWLIDALKAALSRINQGQVKRQLSSQVPEDVQKILASAGIRDEHVFPVPAILEAAPTLIDYYRLLLGVSQKAFYDSRTGLGKLKSMETRGQISLAQRAMLTDFCMAMTIKLAELVRQLSPTVTKRDLAELPLLTLGSQFQGAQNVDIGKQATLEVFLAIEEIVRSHIIERDERSIKIRNAAGRLVVVSLTADPDVRIEEDFSGSMRKKVAIEIKGGTDKSNAHNRAGEAEKSHQKAKRQGFRDFWTIIAMKGLDATKLQGESPTTNSWFDVAQVLGRSGDDWDDFCSRLTDETGIPISRHPKPTTRPLR
ncbi:MAG TPA: XcyI family restriction endonuclease [Pyrinomonadaceae bacterium]|jgi:hypothetical protein|nr:XcyI family restriction endonuclease [Pyrinomonadaceae bacterium]